MPLLLISIASACADLFSHLILAVRQVAHYAFCVIVEPLIGVVVLLHQLDECLVLPLLDCLYGGVSHIIALAFQGLSD